MSAEMLGGWPVVVSPSLPVAPSFGEDIRRRVRHGLADVLEWCGEDLGPEPGEPTRAMYVNGTVFMDQQSYDELRAYADDRTPVYKVDWS